MLNEQAQKIIRDMTSPLKFRLGMLAKLPSVYFWKIKMTEVNEEVCSVKIPFTWRTQNPFKSIYFAALAGAAELSTGIPGLIATAGRGKWSMLVVDFRAEFSKKANTDIIFTCNQVKELFTLINTLEQTNKPGTIELVSTGKDTNGDEVAKIFVTWSFKKKS